MSTLLLLVTGLKGHVLNTSRTYPGLGNLFFSFLTEHDLNLVVPDSYVEDVVIIKSILT